jgi:hypothetical protein
MSVRSAAAPVSVQEIPKGVGANLLLAVAIVSPFDCILAGMIRVGLGVEAICAYLGISGVVLAYSQIRLARAVRDRRGIAGGCSPIRLHASMQGYLTDPARSRR